MASTMTLQDTYFALSTMTGMTLSKFSGHLVDYSINCPNIFFSVHAKLRNAEPGYDFSTSSYFLWCLYEGESGDPNSPDIGFLKGPLLIHVSSFHSMYPFEYLNWHRPIVIYSQLLPWPLLKMPPSVVLGVVMLQQASD